MMKNRIKDRLISSSCLILAASFLISSCKPTHEEICAAHIPKYELELQEASVEIKKLGPIEVANRGPASLRDSDSKRENWEGEFKWERWTEKKLTQTQAFSEVLRDDLHYKEVRAQLSHIADQWVAFHGHVQVGNSERMEKTLAHIQERTQKVRAKACLAPR